MNTQTTTAMSTIWDALVQRSVSGSDIPFLEDGDRAAWKGSDIRSLVRATGARLQQAGIPAGGRVAILLPDNIDLCLAFLSVACHGVAAPLHPGATETDLREWLRDLRPDALLIGDGTSDTGLSVARRLGIPLIPFHPAIDNRSDPEVLLPRIPAPDDTALILHTSGTTAKAKMVPLTHGQLTRSALNVSGTLQLGPGDLCLNVMPMFHIHGLVTCLLAPLVSGGGTIVTEDREAGRFFRLLRERRPTWYSAVPTRHADILQRAQSDPAACEGHCLRLIRSSSAALPRRVQEGLESAFRVPVIEAYGMTEAAHQMCSNPLPPGIRKAGSVGRPAGPEVCVVDADGHRLPDGETGEVAIRGENVTHGYLDLSEGAQGRLPGGWFRTGDLGRFDADGYLFLEGRVKEIVNRGGEKVSPAEVDACLLAHEAVAEAVCFGVPHPSLGEDLAAAVVLHPGRRAEEAELRGYLFDRLSPFKIPSRIVVVDRIPRSSIGKVQRKRMAGLLQGALTSAPEGPVTETERILADLFRECIPGHPETGRNSHFFSLGGDSLHAIRMVQRVGDRFGIELPAHEVFRHPTPALLAVRVEEMRKRMLLDTLKERFSTLTEEQRSVILEKLKRDS